MGFGFKFRLYLENGEDVGIFTTAAPNWRVGEEFVGPENVRFRILDYVDPEDLGDDSPFTGVWTVTPVELPEPSASAQR